MGKSAILRSRFGDRATMLASKQGLTSGHLAARTSLPVARIESILRGTLVPITLDDMTVIADVLGTTLFRLLAPAGSAVSVVAL